MIKRHSFPTGKICDIYLRHVGLQSEKKILRYNPHLPPQIGRTKRSVISRLQRLKTENLLDIFLLLIEIIISRIP